MDREIADRFLDLYEAALTRREKALALYNAVTVALPAEDIPAFLGEGGNDFLSFIRVMQNEDSDQSAAVAYERDAPPAEYLDDLYARLRAR